MIIKFFFKGWDYKYHIIYMDSYILIYKYFLFNIVYIFDHVIFDSTHVSSAGNYIGLSIPSHKQQLKKTSEQK